MILKKYFLIGIIVCLAVAKVKSETVRLTTDQTDQVNTQDSVGVTTESVSVTPEPVIEMDEQNPGNKAEPMKVMSLNLNDEDKVMLQNLNGIIEKLPEEGEAEQTRKQNSRQSKAIKDENFKAAAEALTDDEITEIIKSISFPNEDDLTEDSEALKAASESEVEPRTGRALRTHGYYVIAFTPIQEEEAEELEVVQKKPAKLPYTRLHILPAERSVDGDVFENPRFISKRSWNKYIRRIMRQIRKGTRKVQRKTKVKSLKEEPTTVENFLKRMYTIAQEKNAKQQQETQKKTSWLVW